MGICTQTKMQIAFQVLCCNMKKKKYKTKKKNIVNLDKFYNKFNKETKDKDGNTKFSNDTFGL